MLRENRSIVHLLCLKYCNLHLKTCHIITQTLRSSVKVIYVLFQIFGHFFTTSALVAVSMDALSDQAAQCAPFSSGSYYYRKKCLFLQKITILNKNPKYNVLVILRVGVSDSIWQAREGLFPHCFDILFRCEAYHLVHRCSILE